MAELLEAVSKFGRWTFVRRSDVPRKALFRCDCGVERETFITNVVSGKSTSCGCFLREWTTDRSTKHGHAKRGNHSPLYETWAGMVARCTKKYRPDYHRYGGRGIKVCDRWMVFENFAADMGDRPEGMTLDRHPDTNGNYEPGNCRWATPTEQANNRRSNVLIDHQGKQQNIEAWSKELGIDRHVIEDRIRRGETDPIKIFGPRRQTRIIEFNGKAQTITQWAADTGLSVAGINKRIQKGLPVEEVLRR
jgi:hypothetical protein